MESQINHGLLRLSVSVNEDARQELPAGWNLSAACTGATGPRETKALALTVRTMRRCGRHERSPCLDGVDLGIMAMS